MQRVIARAIGRNQLLILNRIKKRSGYSITSVLCELSDSEGIALSTLKANARTLSELGLIEIELNKGVWISELGNYVTALMSGNSDFEYCDFSVSE